MIWFHLLIVLAFIILGARFGGIGIGFAGAAGVLVLAITGVSTSTDDIPWAVIGIIMAVRDGRGHMHDSGGQLSVIWFHRAMLGDHDNSVAPRICHHDRAIQQRNSPVLAANTVAS